MIRFLKGFNRNGCGRKTDIFNLARDLNHSMSVKHKMTILGENNSYLNEDKG